MLSSLGVYKWTNNQCKNLNSNGTFDLVSIGQSTFSYPKVVTNSILLFEIGRSLVFTINSILRLIRETIGVTKNKVYNCIIFLKQCQISVFLSDFFCFEEIFVFSEGQKI